MSYFDESELQKLARKRLGISEEEATEAAGGSSFLDTLKSTSTPNLSKWATLAPSLEGEKTEDARKSLENAEEVAAALGNDDESLGEKAKGVLTGALDFIGRTGSAGAGFMKESFGYDAKTGDHEGGSVPVLGAVGVGVDVIKDLIDEDDDDFERYKAFWKGITGEEKYSWDNAEPFRKEDDDNWLTRSAKWTGGLGADILSDPLTYVTFGAGGVAKKAGSEILENTVATTATKSKALTDELAETSGLTGRYRNTEIADDIKVRTGAGGGIEADAAKDMGVVASSADEDVVKQLIGKPTGTAPAAVDDVAATVDDLGENAGESLFDDAADLGDEVGIDDKLDDLVEPDDFDAPPPVEDDLANAADIDDIAKGDVDAGELAEHLTDELLTQTEMLTKLLRSGDEAGETLSARAKAVEVLAEEAAEAYALRGPRGYRAYVESDKVPDALKADMMAALPKNLDGGIKFKSWKRTESGARDVIQLTDGKWADRVGLGRVADAKHDAGNWLRTSRAGHWADQVTGRHGEEWGNFLHGKTRAQGESGYMSYGEYRRMAEASRSERAMRGALGSMAVTAIHTARQEIDALPKAERQAAHAAAREFYNTGVTKLPEGASAAQVAGMAAADQVRGIQASLLQKAQAEGYTIGELNDYMTRMQTQDYRKLRQDQAHLASGAVRGSGTAPSKHRVAFFDLNDDGSMRMWDNAKINKELGDKLGGKAAMEEDPFLIAAAYATTMTRAITEKHWYNRLKQSGLTVTDAGDPRKLLAKTELHDTYTKTMDRLDEEAGKISGRLEQLGGIEGSNRRPADRMNQTAGQRRAEAAELLKSAQADEWRVTGLRNSYGVGPATPEARQAAEAQAWQLRNQAGQLTGEVNQLDLRLARFTGPDDVRAQIKAQRDELNAQSAALQAEASAVLKGLDPFADDMAEIAAKKVRAQRLLESADGLDDAATRYLEPKTQLLDEFAEERSQLERAWDQVDADRTALQAALKDNTTVAGLINTFSNDPAEAVREAGELLSLMEGVARRGVVRKSEALDQAQTRLALKGDDASNGLRTHIDITTRERSEFEDMVTDLKRQVDVVTNDRQSSTAARLLRDDYGWERALEARDGGVKNFRSNTEDTTAVYALPAIRTLIDKRNALAADPTRFSKFVDEVYSPLFTMQKTWMTVGRGPGYHVRNGIGAAINNWLIGVDARDYLDTIKIETAREKALLELRKDPKWSAASPELKQERIYAAWRAAVDDLDVAPGIKGGQLLDAAKANGILDNQRLLEDVSAASLGTRNLYKRPVAELSRGKKLMNKTVDNKPINISAQLAQNEERYFRMAALINGAKRYGLDDDGKAASIQVKISQFDYDDLSDFERKVMRNIIPFYTFTRHNVPRQVRSMIHDPGKIANQFKVFEASMDAIGAEEDPDAPSWTTDAFGRTLDSDSPLAGLLGIDKGDELIVRMESPTTALNQWGTTGGIGDWANLARTSMLAQTNPLLKGPVNVFGDTDLETGAKLSESKNAAPNWLRQVEKVLPGDMLLKDSEQAGDKVSAAPALTNLVSEWVPPVGMYERLMPWQRPEKYDTRAGTSWASTLTGAPVSTLDDTQRSGELRARTDRVRAWIDEKAGELGVDSRELSQLIDKYGVEEVRKYLESGGR